MIAFTLDLPWPGMVADIEKAFLNIAIDEEQKDMMRFLWIDDMNKDNPYVEVYRFCRVIFGMKCSPFLHNATLRHHITNYYYMTLALQKGFFQSFTLMIGQEEENPRMMHIQCIGR